MKPNWKQAAKNYKSERDHWERQARRQYDRFYCLRRLIIAMVPGFKAVIAAAEKAADHMTKQRNEGRATDATFALYRERA